jgi:NAD-dependent dihydropyrimidine dehydrogenase PreA subunit
VSIPRSRRERLPWFPTINSEVCLADLECLNFCPADVFDWDPATGKPVVAHPYDCIPGCRSCAEKCKAKGISLPGKKEVAAALKRIRAEDGFLSLRGKGQRTRAEEGIPSLRVKGPGWGRAMPQGSRKKVAKGSKRKPRNPVNLSAT